MRLQQLADELPQRYTNVLPHLACARVLSSTQLDQLLAEPDVDAATTARTRRRILTRLHHCGLVAVLDRRIGGRRAGSTGHIYTLTTAGHRFLTLAHPRQQQPRRVRAGHPGAPFLTHALAISDIYVDLITTTKTLDHVTVATFVTEPHCWWPTGNGTDLRPDAYLVLKRQPMRIAGG